jgi:hypothetical protein
MYKLRNYTVLGLISLSVSLLASCRAEEQVNRRFYERSRKQEGGLGNPQCSRAG